MSSTIVGWLTWGGERDSEGHRTWMISHLIEADLTTGPYEVLQTAGLPLIGSSWAFGDDLDIYAFCYPDAKVSIHSEKEGDPNRWWRVENKFSTKPLKKCQDTEIENPLAEPQQVSGSINKRTVEFTQDIHGNYLKSTSFEQFRGANVEFDQGRPTVKIIQNVADLELEMVTEMVDTLNDAPLWGLPARTIKLSGFSWERKVQGSCQYYYTRTFEFEIESRHYDTTKYVIPGSGENNGTTDGTPIYKWDRLVDNTGARAIAGHHATADDIAAGKRGWVVHTEVNGQTLNRDNPLHYDVYTDPKSQATTVKLISAADDPDRYGEPIDPNKGDPDYWGAILVQAYDESNFLLLGIPTSF